MWFRGDGFGDNSVVFGQNSRVCLEPSRPMTSQNWRRRVQPKLCQLVRMMPRTTESDLGETNDIKLEPVFILDCLRDPIRPPVPRRSASVAQKALPRTLSECFINLFE